MQIVQVAQAERLDIVHAHYAIPHATAAYLARQVLASTPGARVPRVITTLHGTDITLLGVDPSYSEIVAIRHRAVGRRHRGVGEPEGRHLSRAWRARATSEVIPNFIDCDKHRRMPVPDLRASLAPAAEKLLIHVSNFRPVKRVDAAMEVFARMRAQVPARLLLVGDGPDLGQVQRLATRARRRPTMSSVARGTGPGDSAAVGGRRVPAAVGAGELRPGRARSHGLRRAGRRLTRRRTAEVVDDGVSGCLHAADDVDGMARSVVVLADRRGLARAHGVRRRRTPRTTVSATPKSCRCTRRITKNHGRSEKWIALTIRDSAPAPA